MRARAADGGACLCGAGGRLHPLPPPARLPGRAVVPGRAQAPPEPRKAGKRARKRRKSGRSPPPPSPPPPPRPAARKVRAAPGAGGEESGGPGPEPPPRAPARRRRRRPSAPRPGAVCKLRPFCGAESYAPPSRGRCCCSSPPPPPAALSPSPRSPCGSHFSLSLLVVTRKAGQGRKNPRNFKWPLRVSPLRVRGWESPQGRGCAGALPHQLPPRSPALPLAFYLKKIRP